MYVDHIYEAACAAGAAVGLIFAAIALLLHRSKLGAALAGLLNLSVACWCGGSALEMAARSLPQKLICVRVEWIGLAFGPTLWALLAMHLAGRLRSLTRGQEALLSAIPLVTIAAAVTAPRHKLFYTSMRIAVGHGVPLLTFHYGPLWVLHFAWSYALAGAGTAMLASSLWSPVARQSRRAALLLAGMLPLVAAQVLYLAKLGPYPSIDFTPAAAVFTGLTCLLGLSMEDFWEAGPLAREAVFRLIAEGVLVLQGSGTGAVVTDANPAAFRLLGIPAQNLLGRRLGEALPPVAAALEDGSYECNTVVAGTARRLEVTPSTVGAQASQMVVLVSDITRRAELEDALEYMAYHDPISCLLNARAFRLRAEEILANCRATGQGLLFLMVDIDDFKGLNDARGHLAGDAAIAGIGYRLGAWSDHFAGRHGVRAATARLGGDEFAVMMPLPAAVAEALAGGLGDGPESAPALGILEAFREPVPVPGDDLLISVSVGVVAFLKPTAEFTQALAGADSALYRAKAEGRGRVRWSLA